MPVTLKNIVIAGLYIYYVLLLFACFCGLFYFRKVDRATRFLCLWIFTGGIIEPLAWYFRIQYNNNLGVYNVYSITELSLITLYYNYSVQLIQRKRLGIIIIAVGAIIWMANAFWWQPFDSSNANFIFIECLTVVCLSLYAIYRQLLLRHDRLVKRTHFWIPVIFLFYGSNTIFSWGLFDYFHNHYSYLKKIYTLINFSMLLFNITTYSAFILVLLLYAKMKREETP